VRAATLREKLSTTILGLLGALGDEGKVRGLLLLVLLDAGTLEGDTVALPLELGGGDEALDLGGLAVGLLALGGHLATHDKLAHIILRSQVEKLADLSGPLWSKAEGLLRVGQAGNLSRTLLDEDQVEDRQVLGHDASTNRLALHLASATLTVALAALAEEQTHAVWGQDTLHHGETLFVVAARDAETVALELVTESITGNLLGHTLVEEWQQLLVVINVDALLHARGGTAHVELHDRLELQRRNKDIFF